MEQTSNDASEQSDSKPIALFDGLVDLVEQNGKPAFLIKGGNELVVRSQVELEGETCVPPTKTQIPWSLPRAEQVLKWYEESDGALYDALLAYHHSISELPAESYYDLIVAWEFHTYLVETFRYSPIICLFAVPERGKSRTGKAMIYVAYRGIHVESLREAYLLRMGDYYRATLFFDVMNLWEKAEQYRSEDILLQRFEQGATVFRVLNPDRGPFKDMKQFTIFGATLIGTNEGIHHILGTRAIQINMQETTKRFESDITPMSSLPLKERLVAFRARHLGETLPDLLKPSAGRLGDILKPMLQILHLVKPEREATFLELVKKLEADRLIEKTDSLEAEILKAVVSLKGSVRRGLLPNMLITDTVNNHRSKQHQITPTKVGKRLAAIGFHKEVLSDGASAIVYDERKLKRFLEQYGLSRLLDGSDTSDGLGNQIVEPPSEGPNGRAPYWIEDDEVVRRRKEEQNNQEPDVV